MKPTALGPRSLKSRKIRSFTEPRLNIEGSPVKLFKLFPLVDSLRPKKLGAIPEKCII
jgi:hypothetical protein